MNSFLLWIVSALQLPKKNSFRGNYLRKYGIFYIFEPPWYQHAPVFPAQKSWVKGLLYEVYFFCTMIGSLRIFKKPWVFFFASLFLFYIIAVNVRQKTHILTYIYLYLDMLELWSEDHEYTYIECFLSDLPISGFQKYFSFDNNVI